MTEFQSAMDKLMIAGNIMNEQMNVGMMDPSADMNVFILFENFDSKLFSRLRKCWETLRWKLMLVLTKILLVSTKTSNTKTTTIPDKCSKKV